MQKHNYIFSNNHQHSTIHTKGLRIIKPRSSGYICIEFFYTDSQSYSWTFDSEKDMKETYEKLKKSLNSGRNIDDNITL